MRVTLENPATHHAINLHSWEDEDDFRAELYWFHGDKDEYQEQVDIAYEGKFGNNPKFTINWRALGSQDLELTEQYAALLTLATRIARRTESKIDYYGCFNQKLLPIDHAVKVLKEMGWGLVKGQS